VTTHIAYDELVALLRAIFLRHACSETVAAILAENMAGAERDGAHSHGIFRIKGNLASLDTGWVDGKAEPVLEDVAPGMLRADGRNGFSLPVLELAREALTAKARANGIAVLSVRKAHHFSAVWPDIEPFARQGFIALAMINSMASVVPHGGHRKVYGTNPFGFAAPRDGTDPLVFDQASSAMANGDVQIARREGRQLPPGTGVDGQGNPTTDPAAILDGGALLPFGGHNRLERLPGRRYAAWRPNLHPDRPTARRREQLCRPARSADRRNPRRRPIAPPRRPPLCHPAPEPRQRHRGG
jgi:delta1-piperideine-2-carboxylate reductase